MKKRTIFLDIDGVLATNKEYSRNRTKFHKKFEIARKLHIPYPYNPECVKILNEILQETDSQIILSSDWRLHWDIEEIDQIFKFNQIIKSPVGFTQNMHVSMSNLEKNRINEIENYIKNHDVGSYVIIDDLDMGFYGLDRFVKTKDSEGIKQTGLKEKIIKILSE
jgi:hypothetical protein